jgi:hypothetical protein
MFKHLALILIVKVNPILIGNRLQHIFLEPINVAARQCSCKVPAYVLPPEEVKGRQRIHVLSISSCTESTAKFKRYLFVKKFLRRKYENKEDFHQFRITGFLKCLP